MLTEFATFCYHPPLAHHPFLIPSPLSSPSKLTMRKRGVADADLGIVFLKYCIYTCIY